jgi:hypothetical protein
MLIGIDLEILLKILQLSGLCDVLLLWHRVYGYVLK